jgi:hypothetical protein
MKKILILPALLLWNKIYSQGGWLFESNPNSAVTQYSTFFPYIGTSFVDLNNDEYPDLIAAPQTVMMNNGDGTFSFADNLDYIIASGISGTSAADLDNDGDNDLVVSCLPSKVFFNDGSGNFSDSTSNVPSFSNYGSWAAGIGDLNEDARLDFVLAHANGFHPGSVPSPCRFYRQTENGFNPEQISGYPFTTSLSSYTNPYWSDYDFDGDMDLFIASGPANGTADFDPCYKNMWMETGDDTLVAMTDELFATHKQDGQCYNFIDFDNDGDLDLCLTNYFSAQTRFYKNNGGTYLIFSTPFSTTTTNLASCWGDYDNDGDLDVIITNDNQVSKYYRNNGDETFTFLSGGFSTPTATCGIANGDFDQDGDLDVFTNGVGNNGNTSSVGLYINDTVAGNRNFVNLRLAGVISNRSAIGAIVRLKASIKGAAVWQMREVNAQNSFQGQNDLRVHFGLGDAATIDSIVVTWPAGATESYTNMAANSFYRIEEGLGINTINVSVNSPVMLPHFSLYPNPVHDVLSISFEINEGHTYHFELLDLNGAILRSAVARSSIVEMEVTDWPPGCYFIRAYNQEKVVVKKFIRN